MLRQIICTGRRPICRQPEAGSLTVAAQQVSVQLNRIWSSSSSSSSDKIDRSKVPQISEDDLEEQFVRGSGPGGQNVNKRSTSVWLRHVPTGLSVRCQQKRTQEQNRIIAREMLRDKLDDMINGENSVAAQIRRLDQERLAKNDRRAERLRDMKRAFRERENLD